MNQLSLGMTTVIKRLIIAETGTYNPMFHRPYTSNAQALPDIIQQIDDVLQETNGRLTSTSFQGLSMSIVVPSAQPQGEVTIANGWQEKRCRFILEVDVQQSFGGVATHIFQGFTSHAGVTASGFVDPTMVFYINSFSVLTSTVYTTPVGQQIKSRLIESNRVITSDMSQSQYAYQPLYLTRPQDIYGNMEFEQDILNQHEFLDTRSMINRETKLSSRKNDIPSMYLGRLVDNYSEAKVASSYDLNSSNATESARRAVSEHPIVRNPFIMAMNGARNTGVSNTFNYGDLLELDNYLDPKTRIVLNKGRMLQHSHSHGQTEYWSSVGREAQIASIVSKAIPSIMMDLLFGKISMSVTNNTVNGLFEVIILGHEAIVDADMRQNFDAFKWRVIQEVMLDISYSGQMLISVFVNADIFGETSVNVSVDNMPEVPFNAPTFCDSMSAPVVTNRELHESFTNDMGYILGLVSKTTQNPMGIQDV